MSRGQPTVVQLIQAPVGCALHAEHDADVAVVARAGEGDVRLYIAQGQQNLVLLFVGVGAHLLLRRHARQPVALQLADGLPSPAVVGGHYDDGVTAVSRLGVIGQVGVQRNLTDVDLHAGPVHLQVVAVAFHGDIRVDVAVEGLILVAQRESALPRRDCEGGWHFAAHDAVGGQLRREVIVERRRGIGSPVEREVAERVVPHHHRPVKVFSPAGIQSNASCQSVLAHCDITDECCCRSQTDGLTVHDKSLKGPVNSSNVCKIIKVFWKC